MHEMVSYFEIKLLSLYNLLIKCSNLKVNKISQTNCIEK